MRKVREMIMTTEGEGRKANASNNGGFDNAGRSHSVLGATGLPL